jgi:hypothetical protein
MDERERVVFVASGEIEAQRVQTFLEAAATGTCSGAVSPAWAIGGRLPSTTTGACWRDPARLRQALSRNQGCEEI